MRKFIKQVIVAMAALLLFIIQPAGSKLFAAATVSREHWQQLTGDKAFTYKNDIEAITPPKPPDTSFFQNIITSLFAFLGSGAGNVLLWLIVIAIVAFIVYKLLLSSDSILFSRGNKKMSGQLPETENTEDITVTDWEALLQNAVANKDYTLAVRYSYMRLLQLLHKRKLITFSSDKTNFDYYAELGDTTYKQPFRLLSRQYEYAWYGRFALSGNEYEKYIALFNQLQKQLHA